MSDQQSQENTAYWGGAVMMIVGLWFAYRVLLKVLAFLGLVLSFLGCVFLVVVGYLGFYVIPVALTSLLAGKLMLAVSGIGKLDYRRLIFVQASLCLIAFWLVGVPTTKTKEVVEITKMTSAKVPLSHKSAVTPVGIPAEQRHLEVVIQSPRLNAAYVRLRIRASDVANVGATLLPDSYDLINLSACVWVGLLLGGPTFFLFASQAQKEKEEERLAKTARAPIQIELEDANAHLYEMRNEVRALRYNLKVANSELERLRARDEFLTHKEKTPAEPTGVLDSDSI